MEDIDGNFLTEVINDQTWVGPFLNTMSTNGKTLWEMGRSGKALTALTKQSCSSGSRQKGRRQKVESQLCTSEEQVFVLFRNCLNESQRRQEVRRRGVQESVLFVMDHIQAQQWLNPMIRILSKGGRRHLWMNKALLTKLKYQKEVYRWQKEGRAAQGKCRDTICWEEFRRVKTHLELD